MNVYKTREITGHSQMKVCLPYWETLVLSILPGHSSHMPRPRFHPWKKDLQPCPSHGQCAEEEVFSALIDTNSWAREGLLFDSMRNKSYTAKPQEKFCLEE